MPRRVGREVRSPGRERLQEPASEERLPHELIRLQRSAGNQAVAALLQRRVRVPGAVIDAVNYASRQPGLETALQELGRAKGWKPSFVDEVRARMVEMINDAATYPGATRMFKSYKQFITTVANELLLKNAPSPRLGKQLDPLEPMEIEPGEARIDPEASLLGQIHDEASLVREDFLEEVPEEFQVGANRRTQQKAGTLDPSVIPQVAVGGYTGEIRGHGSVVTNVGGGPGADYAELFSHFTTALSIAKRSDKAAGDDILAMLHGNASALLAYSNFALVFLDRALTILAGAESSRATGSVIHFAATIHRIAQGGDTFVNAFSGKAASFLGANEGGADALRHQTSTKLLGQESRARDAAEAYLGDWGNDIDLSTLTLMLQTNIASYSRLRQEKKDKAKS